MKHLLNSLAVVAVMAVATPVIAQQAAPAAARAPQARTAAPVSEADFVARRMQGLRAADANNDGQVTPEERRAHHDKMRAERTEARFTRLDSNADGQISREEFAAGHTRMEHMQRGEGAHRMGAHAGRDRVAGHRGTGHQHMARMNMNDRTIDLATAEQKARENFAALDANRDGQVTREERRAAHQAMREMRRGERAARQPSPSAPVSE